MSLVVQVELMNSLNYLRAILNLQVTTVSVSVSPVTPTGVLPLCISYRASALYPTRPKVFFVSKKTPTKGFAAHETRSLSAARGPVVASPSGSESDAAVCRGVYEKLLVAPNVANGPQPADKKCSRSNAHAVLRVEFAPDRADLPETVKHRPARQSEAEESRGQ